MNRLFRISAVRAWARFGVLMLPAMAAHALPVFTVHDLGVVSGQSSYGNVEAVNASGQSVGASAAGALDAFAASFAVGTSPVKLAALSNLIGFSGEAYAINAAGTIVGATANYGTNSSRATLFRVGQSAVDLGTLGGTNSAAMGINSAGQIVGLADASNGKSSAALFVQNGTNRNLGALSGSTSSLALGINDSGQIVGTSVASDGTKTATLFSTSAAPVSLGGLAGYRFLSGSGSIARAVSNTRIIVGTSAGYNTSGHAVIFHVDGTVTDLGTLGGNESDALAVNDADDIVGDSEVQSASGTSIAPFLYEDGVMTNLDTLLADSGGFLLFGVQGINDLGQIVGIGSRDGQVHALLLDPGASTAAVPEPGSALLFLVGIVPLARVLTRRRGSPAPTRSMASQSARRAPSAFAQRVRALLDRDGTSSLFAA